MRRGRQLPNCDRFGMLGTLCGAVFIFSYFPPRFSSHICTRFLREKQQEFRVNSPREKGFPIGFVFLWLESSSKFCVPQITSRMLVKCHFFFQNHFYFWKKGRYEVKVHVKGMP